MELMKLDEAKEIIRKELQKDIVWLRNNEKNNDYFANKYRKEANAYHTVLQELKRLQKENERYENKIILSDEEYRRVIDEAQKDCVSKDKIREKIDNRISTIKNLLDEMVDKSIGCINVSYLSKKEKEKVILKRNCLTVQKATLIDIKKDLLKEE